MNRSIADHQFERQDIGYLLTAYADGQLAPEGVMWVEEQLDRIADLRAKLKEIRHLQAGLRTAFAGGAPAFVLDLPRRDALLASAANPPRKKIRFPRPLWIGLAASILVMVAVMSTSPVGMVREMARMSPEARARADAESRSSRKGDDYSGKLDDAEHPPMKVTSIESKEDQFFARGERPINALLETDGSNRGPTAGEKSADGVALRMYDSTELVTEARNFPAPGAPAASAPAPAPALELARRERDGRQFADEGKRVTNTPAASGKPGARPGAVQSSTTPVPTGTAMAKSDRGLPAKDSAPTSAEVQWPEEHKLLSESTRTAMLPGLELKTYQPEWPENDTRGRAKETRPPVDPLAPPSPVAVAKPAHGGIGYGQQGVGHEDLSNTSSATKALAKMEQKAELEQSEGYASRKPAPTKPTAGPQNGMDKNRKANKEVEQLPVELTEADVVAPAPISQLDVPLEEKSTSEDEQSADVAKGREEAVASSETGATGAFMAIGAGGRIKTTSEAEKELIRLRREGHIYLRQLPADGKPAQSANNRGADILAAQKRVAEERLELVRQSNNEKTHIAEVSRAVALQLNTKLAEVEDDYNKETNTLVQSESQKVKGKSELHRQVEVQAAQLEIAKQRYPKLAEFAMERRVEIQLSGDAELDDLRRRAVEQQADLAMIKDRYPKIAAEITDEKQSASFLQGVVGAVRNNPQGEPDMLMLTLGKGDQVEQGMEFIVFRENNYIVRVRAEKVMNDMVACRIISDSWNSRGLQIQQGDLAQPRLGGGEARPAVDARSLLVTSSDVDPQQSLAALRAPVTLDGTLGLAQSLRLIGGEKIGYTLTTGVQGLLERQVQVNLRDEAAARGVLRAVRSAGLQAQFTGGVVHLDVATRPLDPSDTQGYDLPTFKDLFGTSPMQVTAVDAIQTVAIDADTASYQYAKARVAAGQPVDPTTIKPEHFINAMPMDYPAAQGPEAFTLFAEAAPSPFARAGTSWGSRTALVSIGAVAKPAAADERKPLALTLAIDCSGSMAQAGGLDRIQRGLLAFVEHLRAEDRVSIVAFGDQARVILPATPGNDRAALINALANLATGGATNAAEGLGLAYQLAAETAAVGVESRVLLATDGGTVAGADDLLRRVTAFKDRGITLVVVGTGATYRAGPLQELATKGDGQHFYVGSDDDAQALFTGKLLPDRLAVLAKDAKLQVTWNPQRVSHARLIGYDQRRLAAKDFRDNTVDAGELSQDTQVTALFEVLLVDGGAGPLGTAAVRYKDMRREQVRELACPLPGTILQSQPSERLRLLACAAATAEWLQRGWWSNVHLITPQEIAAQLARCRQPIAAELREMVK